MLFRSHRRVLEPPEHSSVSRGKHPHNQQAPGPPSSCDSTSFPAQETWVCPDFSELLFLLNFSLAWNSRGEFSFVLERFSSLLPSPSHCGAVLLAVLSSAGLSVVASGCDGLGAPPGPSPSLSPGPLPAEARGLLCLCGAFASGASRACHQRSRTPDWGQVAGDAEGGGAGLQENQDTHTQTRNRHD